MLLTKLPLSNLHLKPLKAIITLLLTLLHEPLSSALKYLMSREAETLSGGEMQMVAIGRALLGSPGLVLFDEPSQGLAPKIVDDVMAVVRRLKGEGIAAIVVEQNAELALSVADRVVVLSHGTVAWAGDAAVLTADPVLKRTLLGGAQ